MIKLSLAALRASAMTLAAVAAVTTYALTMTAATPAHADPGDFGAMPGLWKIQVRHVTNGKAGAPGVHWYCVDEGADPWETFAAWTPGDGDCTATDRHRRSTSLAWKLTCKGGAVASARVDFDSAKHYTGSVTLEGGGEITQVEGDRYAACTSPED